MGAWAAAGLSFSNSHSTPSLDAVINSWTPSSAPVFCPSHQCPLELICGLGEIWEEKDRLDTVLGAGVGCLPLPF